ncbi:carboxypeptidase regulatory-like domain-containing protein [Archangium gephyra]|nr:carboxypeptidase regulatory-like domain-containing protein [Archangium gephyra]
MRRGWVLGAVLGVLAVGAWLSIRSKPSASHRVASTGTRASVSSASTVPWALLQSALPASGNTRLPIRGLVRGPKGPVPGAVVLASAPVAGESLSELTCVEYGESRALLDCSSGPEREQLLALVARREGEAPVAARAVTETDGTFTLEGLEPGPYSLWVESAEGTGLKHDVAAGSEGVDLQVGAGVRLSGTVTDDAGSPVAGALVTAIFKVQSRFFEAMSDERGHFRLGPFPPGEYTLLITKEGLETWSDDFTGYAPEVEKTFILAGPKRVSGRVLRAGTPVAGAEVRVRVDPRDPPGPRAVALTDAAGRFSFEGLRPQSYHLIATQGGEGALEQIHFGETQRELTEVTLELAPAAYVRGRVLDEERRPVQGALISVEWMNEMKRGLLVARADEEGRYQLGPMPAGPVHLIANKKGRVPRSHEQEVSRGEHTVDFTLVRTVFVEGVLVDAAGQPVAEESLSLRPLEAEAEEGELSNLESGTSGADGRFSLAAPMPGRYQLAFGGKRVKKQVVEVLAPSSQRLVGVPLPSVEVEVVDEAGIPLPDVSLGLWPATAAENPYARVAWGRTDLKGRARAVAPEAGRYRLAAELARDDFIRNASQWVDLGDTPAQVRLRFAGGQGLSGIVVDLRGEPIADVYLRVESPLDVQREGCGGASRGVSTGPDGRFVFSQLLGERFILTAQKGFYEPKPPQAENGRLEVTPGMKDLRLVLDRNVRIRGRLIRADGAPISRIRVNGVLLLGEVGSFSVLVPDAEARQIHLSAPGFKPVQRAVADQEQTEVDLGTITLVPEG